MAEEKKRISWIDTFKAFMIIFVAFGHVVCEEEAVGYACNYYIHTFHVAGFFFVSGYLFSNTNGSFMGFLKKKLTSLMVPYYIFAFISLLIFIFMGSFAASGLNFEGANMSLWKNILGIFYANGLSGYMKWNLPMWFIPCLFISVLIFYFIVLLKNRIGSHIVTLIAMIIILAFNTVNYYWLDIKCLPFGLETAMYMLPIMLFGFLIRPYIYIDSFKIYQKIICSILFLGLGAITSFAIGASVSFVSSIYGNLFVFYASCVLSIVGFVFLSSLIDFKWLNYIGQNTMAILILHKFPIVFMQLLVGKFMKNSWVNNICLSVIITVVSILLSLICSAIITTVAPVMLGKNKKSK